jgi:hypothetical protein
LIHSRAALTHTQQRIANILLYKAYPELMRQRVHQISVRELAGHLEYSGKHYAWIIAAARALMTTVVERFDILNDVSESEEEVRKLFYEGSTVIASVRIRDGVIEYEYSEVMRQWMYEPEVYGRLDLQVQNRLTSAFGQTLYENCVRFQRVQSTGWMSVEQWRELFGLPDSKYPRFSDFNKWVISVAINDVNENTPLSISAEYRKTGRRFTHIRVLIRTSEEQYASMSDEQRRLVAALRAKGVEELTAIDLVDSVSSDAIRKGLEELSWAMSRRDLRNPAGWLIKSIQALSENRKSAEARARVVEAMAKAQSDLPLDETAQERREILHIFHELEESKKAPIWKEFMATQPATVRRIAERHLPEIHPGVAQVLVEYIREHRPDLIEGQSE